MLCPQPVASGLELGEGKLASLICRRVVRGSIGEDRRLLGEEHFRGYDLLALALPRPRQNTAMSGDVVKILHLGFGVWDRDGESYLQTVRECRRAGPGWL